MLCGALATGAHHVTVFVREPSQPGARPWVGALARARASVRLLGPLTVEAGVDGGLSLLRYQFVSRNRESPVFTQSFATISFYAGVGVEL